MMKSSCARGPDINAWRMAPIGMHLAPFFSTQVTLGGIGRGWSGTRRMISSWTTMRVTTVPIEADCTPKMPSSNGSKPKRFAGIIDRPSQRRLRSRPLNNQ